MQPCCIFGIIYNMIYGNGVDNVELSRISAALERSQSFAKRVLTENELVKFDSFKSKTRQTEFLAGRWAAKEAYSKAYGTGISSQLSMQDLEIENDKLGKPIFTKHPFDGSCHLSISHSNLEAVAFVVLEN